MQQINLRAITIKQLETFVAVADGGSFRLAAEVLRRSQSAISAQIQQLEQELGVAVFHRTTRRVELTAEGKRFLQHARRAFGELSTGVRDIQEIVEYKQGRIHLACSPTVGGGWLPRLVADFQAAYPEVVLHMREAHAYDMLEDVRNQNADFGIGPTIATETAFDFRELWEEDICAVVSRPSVFDARSTITLKEIANHPVLVMPRNSAIRRMVDEAFSSIGITLTPKIEVLHYHTLLGMAAAGLGVAILPRLALTTVSQRNLRGLTISSPRLRRSVSVISLRGRAFSPATARFVQLLERRGATAKHAAASLLRGGKGSPSRGGGRDRG